MDGQNHPVCLVHNLLTQYKVSLGTNKVRHSKPSLFANSSLGKNEALEKSQAAKTCT